MSSAWCPGFNARMNRRGSHRLRMRFWMRPALPSHANGGGPIGTDGFSVLCGVGEAVGSTSLAALTSSHQTTSSERCIVFLPQCVSQPGQFFVFQMAF